MKVAVVILNFNGQKLMERFLPGVIAHTYGAEVIIADNCSTDGSVEWLQSTHPEIRIIEMEENYGFAEGYNRALRQIDSEYYVLLNSDIEIKSDWLSPMVRYMDTHPECGASQPKILSQAEPDKFEHAGASGGYIDKYGYPFCRGRIFDKVEADLGQYDSRNEIFWASGACLLIRAELYHNIGGLDGDFFAHQEEIDMCWRMKSRGHSIVCIPEGKVYHVGAGTLGYESPRKTYLNFRNNAIMLYKNVWGVKYKYLYTVRLLLDWVAALQMLLRGKRSNSLSILKAQKDFLRLRKNFKQKRFANLKKTINFAPVGVLDHLLLWDVHFNKINTFAELSKKSKYINKVH